MGIKQLLVILASLGFTMSALADNHEGGEKKPFSIYGDFATSLMFYDNEYNGDNRHDDFNIDLVEINLEKNWSKSKLHLSIGYGSTANAVNPSIAISQQTATATDSAGDTVSINYVTGAPTDTINIMNAYYHMHTSYGLGFTIGKFESPVGHETYNHMENSQYTRSYGWNLAPFFSTGAIVDYGSDMWKVGLIFSNGSGRDTDARGANAVDKNKTMALTVDVDPMENLHIDLNYVTGTEGDATSTLAAQSTHQINILDFSAAFMINEMFDVALNYIDHGQKLNATGSTENKGTSIAAYLNGNFGMFGLGLRYEQFDFDYGLFFYNGLGTAIAAPAVGTPGTDNSISAITLTAKAEIDQNAMVMLEYRMDTADDNGTFTAKDGTATDSQNIITAALMYRF